MSYDPDVLVIGGGIVGLFGAYFLRLGGASVTVVEAATIGDPVASSYGNTGFVAHGGAPLAGPGGLMRGLRTWVRPDGSLAVGPTVDRHTLTWLRHFRHACTASEWRRCRDVLVDMKERSLSILRELDGPPADAVTATDVIIAYKSADEFAKARRLTTTGDAPIRVLGPGELEELEPDAYFDISGATYHRRAAFLHVPDFVTALSARLREMGVDIREDAEAVGFDVSGSAVTKVRTTAGDFTPVEVVISAGVWSAVCTRLLGFDLMVVPVRGHSITMKTPLNAPRRPVLLTEGTVAVRPLGDELRLAGSLVLTGRAVAARRRMDAILATVRSHLPRMEIPESRTVWTGFRPCTPDSLPLIGRSPAYANVSVATGHGHVGMGLAPAGGRLLAQIVADHRPEMDPTPFRIDRFAGGGVNHG